jgi:hypothetical protein
MVAPVAQPAALHLLTPGSPAYAMLKIGAIGGLFALRFALVRRNRAKEQTGTEAHAVETTPPVRRDPHPVSKKKKRRRRRSA